MPCPTIEQIDARIKAKQSELEALTKRHNDTVQHYQQIIAQGQGQYAQLTGAIAELEELKTGFAE
jgi:hypothetical protein